MAGGGCVGLGVALQPAAIGTCAAALTAGGTFVANCEGACADAADTAVQYLAMSGVEV